MISAPLTVPTTPTAGAPVPVGKTGNMWVQLVASALNATIAFEASLDGTNFVEFARVTAPALIQVPIRAAKVRANTIAYTSSSGLACTIGGDPL